MHPEVEIPNEKLISTGILQEQPETEGETEEGEELGEDAATEIKMDLHNERIEGNTEEKLKPSEESYGLHRWFGFFSPRKPARESGNEGEKERKVASSGGGEIIVGDSWKHGAGDGVMDGSNVHSPTERGPLRDDEPTEMDEKTFFNVRGRYKGQGVEKMAVATSQVIFDLLEVRARRASRLLVDEIFLF